MNKNREDLLAKTLDQAGLLTPLMNVMVEQLAADSKATPKSNKKSKKWKAPSAARQILLQHFPNATEEELDEWEQTT